MSKMSLCGPSASHTIVVCTVHGFSCVTFCMWFTVCVMWCVYYFFFVQTREAKDKFTLLDKKIKWNEKSTPILFTWWLPPDCSLFPKMMKELSGRHLVSGYKVQCCCRLLSGGPGSQLLQKRDQVYYVEGKNECAGLGHELINQTLYINQCFPDLGWRHKWVIEPFFGLPVVGRVFFFCYTSWQQPMPFFFWVCMFSPCLCGFPPGAKKNQKHAYRSISNQYLWWRY